MTASYFSAIEKIACADALRNGAQSGFVAGARQTLAIAPKSDMRAMFTKDIWG